MEAAFVGSFISAMATVVGAIPLLFVKELTEKWKDILVAFSAGIMVSASTFGLMPQAIEESGILPLTIGVLFGILVLDVIERNIPHIDVEDKTGVKSFESKSFLVIIALIIHNIPEGLSTGFSYASENDTLGPMVAVAIGAQNVPEGLILAVFLINSKVSKAKSFGIVTLTGLIEIISAGVGFFAASSIAWLIGYGLAFAAGAMMFIVYKELIPESHGYGNERIATYSFIVGLLVMVYISIFYG